MGIYSARSISPGLRLKFSALTVPQPLSLRAPPKALHPIFKGLDPQREGASPPALGGVAYGASALSPAQVLDFVFFAASGFPCAKTRALAREAPTVVDELGRVGKAGIGLRSGSCRALRQETV